MSKKEEKGVLKNILKSNRGEIKTEKKQYKKGEITKEVFKADRSSLK